MPFMPNGTLYQLLGKPMPWQEAVRFILPLARALEYTHEHNIIHRDIKPSNILLTGKSQPMLSDFGIAKNLDSEATVRATGTGMGVGTYQYMAPEQWTNQACPQSDLYSLGLILYEMVTGRKPYTADSPAAIMLKQANDPLPDPRQFTPDLPEAMVKMLQKALANKPMNRYVNMAAFTAAMETLLDSRSQPIAMKTPIHAQSVTSNRKTPTHGQSKPTDMKTPIHEQSVPLDMKTPKHASQPSEATIIGYSTSHPKPGLPDEDAHNKSRTTLLVVFIVVGIIIALLIKLLWKDILGIFGGGGVITTQMLETGSLSLIVAGIQATQFKSRIKNRLVTFFVISFFGGIIGGIGGGLLLNANINQAFVVGCLNGAIAGGLSSLAQNRIMRNSRYGKNWFWYSLISWTLIFGVGWSIGWQADVIRFGLAAAFLIIATGFSLLIFLRQVPQIEFD
jgi:serine/threonine protein kinase